MIGRFIIHLADRHPGLICCADRGNESGLRPSITSRQVRAIAAKIKGAPPPFSLGSVSQARTPARTPISSGRHDRHARQLFGISPIAFRAPVVSCLIARYHVVS